MELPTLRAGILPEGIHEATLGQVRDRFVESAKNHRRDREVRFAALEVWHRRKRHVLGTGVTWVSGAFVTDLPIAPALRLVHFPDNERTAMHSLKSGLGLPLLTVGDVLYLQPDPGGHSPRTIAVGGMVDAHLGAEGDKALWSALWSSGWALGAPGVSAPMGFVELREGA